MDAILGLLNTYKVPDPAAGKLVGEFVNQELQNLYDELVAKGEPSALDALMAGGIMRRPTSKTFNSPWQPPA